MKEEILKPKTNRPKPSKFSDQNQPHMMNAKVSTNSSKLRCASSWGSHIVKGLSGEKNSKLQTTSLPTKNSHPLQTNKVKRGLIADMSCSVAAAQVHPKPSSSRDLFIEIENLRGLLKESKGREYRLQGEVESMKIEVNVLESQNTTLKKELMSLSSDSRRFEDETISQTLKPQTLEMEVVELRRINKELQLQKRDLACKVASMESQLANFTKPSESETISRLKAEASMLKHTNEDLSKQVEGLQMNRLNEVEELAYLRWVNSQLRNELRCPCSCTNDMESCPHTTETDPVARFPRASNEFVKSISAKRLSAAKKLNKWPITAEDLSSLDCSGQSVPDKRWEELVEGNCSLRRQSISGSKCSDEDLPINKRRQSDGFMCSKESESKEDNLENSQKNAANKVLALSDMEKRALRVPNPPPRPSCANPARPVEASSGQAPILPPPPPPPPPPLPPPRFSVGNSSGAVQRIPQVVEFYHSLMKRDTRRDSTGGATCDSPNVASVRSNMIGEIENRSAYLHAIKVDVETQGEFVNSLIREVNNAVYGDIEDVVAFVKWLDDELCFLVDERAVLKHFDWPEKKADTLREAAFGYKDLKKLESEVTYYHDEPQLPWDIALKKMVFLSEKIERTIYNLLRTRESLVRNCKEFRIPTDWMLDSGIISKWRKEQEEDVRRSSYKFQGLRLIRVKLGSVKLAKKYMNRVALELQSRSSLDKDPAMDYMLLQGVRFAFRIHQFAGGFDAETMQAFEELRKVAHVLNKR